MKHKGNGSIAAAGCAIAVITVGLGVWGLLESIHHWHVENIPAYLGLAIVGGILGIIFIVRIVKAREK